MWSILLWVCHCFLIRKVQISQLYTVIGTVKHLCTVWVVKLYFSCPIFCRILIHYKNRHYSFFLDLNFFGHFAVSSVPVPENVRVCQRLYETGFISWSMPRDGASTVYNKFKLKLRKVNGEFLLSQKTKTNKPKRNLRVTSYIMLI